MILFQRMKFSAQEEYGLRCLIAIARKGPDGAMTIPEISREEGLTTSHVAKLLAILRKAGFVKSTRGQLGGYTLAKTTDKMVLRDVLEALGGRLYYSSFCLRHSGVERECVHETDCNLKPLWASIQAAVDTVVARYTVADVMSGSIPEPLVTMSPVRPERVSAR